MRRLRNRVGRQWRAGRRRLRRIKRLGGRNRRDRNGVLGGQPFRRRCRRHGRRWGRGKRYRHQRAIAGEPMDRDAAIVCEEQERLAKPLGRCRWS